MIASAAAAGPLSAAWHSILGEVFVLNGWLKFSRRNTSDRRRCRIAVVLGCVALLQLAGCKEETRPVNRKAVQGQVLAEHPGTVAGSSEIVIAPTIIEPEHLTPDVLGTSAGVLSSNTRDAKEWERAGAASAGFSALAGGISFASAAIPAKGKQLSPLEKSLQAGLEYLNAGNFSEAAGKFEAAQVTDPRDYRGFFFEAVCRAQLEDLARAGASMDRAIALAPREIELYVHRGNLMLRKKDYGGAVDDFSHVVTLEPKNVPALLNRAVANFHRRRPKDVIADATSVIEIRKDIPDAFLLRALGNIMTGEPARARRDYDAAVGAGLSKQAIDTWRPVFYREG
ncbi:MAG: hypothetical protein C0483_16410 [Pirellula sp.]|nr:hypothetical protein [Pirellula sp.]